MNRVFYFSSIVSVLVALTVLVSLSACGDDSVAPLSGTTSGSNTSTGTGSTSTGASGTTSSASSTTSSATTTSSVSSGSGS